MFSCGKDHTITGRVFNPVNDEGIANIQVQIFKDKFSMPGSQDGAGRKLIETVTTNANGEYAISFNDRDSKHYSLVFNYDTEKYYDNIKTGDIGIEDNLDEYDLPLVENGFLKQIKTNQNCFDSNDVLSIIYKHYLLNDYYFDTYGNYYGCNPTNQDKYNQVPMGWHFAIGTVTKNGISSPFKDSILVTAGGYHTWNIEY